MQTREFRPSSSRWGAIISSLLLAIGFCVSAQAQQSYRTQQSLQQSIPQNRRGMAQDQRIPHNTIPWRFLGWKEAMKQGPDAVRHYMQLDQWPVAVRPQPDEKAQAGNTKERKPQRMDQAVANAPGIELRPSLPAGLMPTAVVAGDFNNDGKPDWVVSNGGDNTLDLYLGNGDGTSQLPVILSLAGKSPVSIAAGDLNRDGNLDLVVAESDTQTVGILFGNGDGTFQPEIELPPFPVATLAVAIADLNGDGLPDLVVGVAGDYQTTATGAFATLLNTGDGQFGAPVYAPTNPYNQFPNAGSLSIADVNSDGIPDVLATSVPITGGDTQIFLGVGDGTFTAGEVVDSSQSNGEPVYVNNAVLSDVNGDGCPDAIVDDSLGNADVFLGLCNGSFNLEPAVYGMGDIGYGLAVADLNGDGHPDIIIGGYYNALDGNPNAGYATGDSIGVRLNDGTGHFGPLHVFRGEPGIFSLAVTDLAGNGHPDVITSDQETNTTTIYANDGSGAFGEPSGGYDGEFNGTAEAFANPPASNFYVADLNGDGLPDLSLIEFPDASTPLLQLTTMLNQGSGQFSPPARLPVFSDQGLIRVSDFLFANFRGAGKQDFLGATFDDDFFDCASPEIVYAPSQGNGTFGTPIQISLPVVNSCFGVSVLGTGDFNGNGKLDFAIASFTGPSSAIFQLTVFLGNGDGTFTQSNQINFGGSDNTVPYPQGLFVEDANSDGKQDILVWLEDNTFGPGTSGKHLLEFLGNGDGTFQQPKIVIPELDYMTMADLNHDGLLDILQVVPAAEGGAPAVISVYLGQSDGSFGSPTTYSPYPAPFLGLFDGLPTYTNYLGPILGDFNGDGNLDLAIFQERDAGTFAQLLVGNGDGTFTPTFNMYSMGIVQSPDLVVPNAFGDGRTAFLQTPNLAASYHLLPTIPAPSIQTQMAQSPVVSGNGSVEVILNTPASSDTTATLTPSDPGIMVPPSVTILAGGLSAEVPFTLASDFPSDRWFSITASTGGTTAVAYNFPSPTGGGPAPAVVLNPPQLYFQVVLPGSPVSQAILLTNSGTASLTIDSINSTTNLGSNGSFSSSSNCADTVAVEASCTITVTYSGTSPGDATGSVTLTDSAPGSRQIASLSASGAGFTLQAASGSSTAATISAGQTATFNLAVVPNAFQGVVTLSCSGAPPSSTCMVPGTVSVSGNAPATFRVTVSTQAAGSIVGPRFSPTRTPKIPYGIRFIAALSILMILLLLILNFTGQRVARSRHGMRQVFSILTLLIFALLLAKCGGGGGGGSNGGGGSGGSGGTPSGTYSVIVAGSADGIQQTIALSVTVQ